MADSKKLKMYFIAGEASGDLHGSNLIKALNKENKSIELRAWGGDKMEAGGAKIVKHIRELAYMGFIEVVSNIRTIFKNIEFCKKDIERFNPDCLILIDYPGFNLRIAKWAKAKGIKVIYYISPQVWAWKQSRVHKIKKSVDKMYVILPFEKDFYARFNFEVEYVGHPLLDAIKEYRESAITKAEFLEKNGLNDLPIIAVLPGSRKQEVKVKLPIMLKALEKFNDYQVVVAGAPSLEESFYKDSVGSEVKIVFDQTYDLLSASEVAVVTSGTATLETAILGIPQLVCYKGSKVSYMIAKKLIKVKFISLVNLIMDKEVVRELIQDDCNPEKIKEELVHILPGGKNRQLILKSYEELNNMLGDGSASTKVAQSLLKTI